MQYPNNILFAGLLLFSTCLAQYPGNTGSYIARYNIGESNPKATPMPHVQKAPNNNINEIIWIPKGGEIPLSLDPLKMIRSSDAFTPTRDNKQVKV